MDFHGNNARFIRAAAARLEEMSEEYPYESAESEEIGDVAGAVRRLVALPDPPDEEGDIDHA